MKDSAVELTITEAILLAYIFLEYILANKKFSIADGIEHCISTIPAS